jgi:predicted CXXCH cytochrome family protein
MLKDWSMKNTMPAAAMMLFLLSAPVAWAGTLIGSPHDFRGYLWQRGGTLCLPCHAPHMTETLPAPLWNPELSTQTFSMYAKTHSPAMDAEVNSQPDGISKICLSCHDGTLAPDTYGGNSAAAAYQLGWDLIGTNPGNNHPISFLYNTALAARHAGLYDPSIKLSGLTGSTGTIAADMLFSNRMECSSCHDVHNKKAVPGTKLLVKDNAGSALCLTCHNK